MHTRGTSGVVRFHTHRGKDWWRVGGPSSSTIEATVKLVRAVPGRFPWNVDGSYRTGLFGFTLRVSLGARRRKADVRRDGSAASSASMPVVGGARPPGLPNSLLKGHVGLRGGGSRPPADGLLRPPVAPPPAGG